MKILFLSLSILFIIITLLPLVPSNHWLFRVPDFPRLQITLFLIISLAGTAYFSWKYSPFSIIIILLTAAAIIYQAVLILKFTPLMKTEVADLADSNSKIKLSGLISNVLMGNRNSSSLLELINKKNPDFVLAVETDEWWHEKLAVLKKDYPFSILHPLDNTYGMLFYSRLEIVSQEINFFIKKDIPSFYLKLKLTDGQIITMYTLHPEPPVPGESETSTPRDAELVLVGKRIEKEKGPKIVAGDLNDVAWSHTTRLFQRISGLLDPRVGRGFYSTFNANVAFFRWPLDHVFISDHFFLSELEVLPNIGSDHFPVYFSFVYNEKAKAFNEKKEPDAEDIEEADETIKDAKKTE